MPLTNRSSVNQLNNEHDDGNNKKHFPYLTIFVIFACELFLYPIVLCYGIFLTEFCIKDFWNLHDGLWPVIAFVAAWIISNTWSCSFCESWYKGEGKVTKNTVITTTFLLFLALSFGSLFGGSLINQTVTYSLLGGWLSSMISVQIKFFTKDLTKDYRQSYKISVQFSRAFAPFLLPHLWGFLANFYGPQEAQFILSPLVLNIIPIICLLTEKTRNTNSNNEDNQLSSVLQKFKTFNSLQKTESVSNTNLNKSSRSSSNYSLEDYPSSACSDEDDENVTSEEPTSPNIQEFEFAFLDEYNNIKNAYQQRNYLPKILEEEEFDDDDDDDDYDDIDEVNAKRLSKISAKLERINNNHTTSISSVNNLYHPGQEDLQILQDSDESLNECLKTSPSLPEDGKNTRSSKLQHFYRTFDDKFDNIKRCLYEECLRNLSSNTKSALKDVVFYFALISKTTTNLFSPLFLATVPYLSHVFQNTNELMDHNTAIGLTVISITWCIFLKAHAILKNFTLFKLRVVFIFGLVILSFSMYCMKNIKGPGWGLLLFGFGHGAVTYSEERAYQHLFGCTNKKMSKRWKRRRPFLQISTAICVILAYTIIYLLRVKVMDVFHLAFYFYTSSTGLWICIPIVKFICCGRVRSVRLHIDV